MALTINEKSISKVYTTCYEEKKIKTYFWAPITSKWNIESISTFVCIVLMSVLFVVRGGGDYHPTHSNFFKRTASRKKTMSCSNFFIQSCSALADDRKCIKREGRVYRSCYLFIILPLTSWLLSGYLLRKTQTLSTSCFVPLCAIVVVHASRNTFSASPLFGN